MNGFKEFIEFNVFYSILMIFILHMEIVLKIHEGLIVISVGRKT